MKSVVKGIMGMVAGFAGVFILKDYVCFVHSPTLSLPYIHFIKFKKGVPEVGSYSCIESPWHKGPIIKQVAGKSGDCLYYDTEGNLWLGEQLIGKPQMQAKDGRFLTPISAGIIPEGFVFVKGDHERSFDSRYKEMGLVPETSLDGWLVGII